MTFPAELQNIHKGNTAYIVGKGASLARLSRMHVGKGVVLAINQAVIAIEALGLPNQTYSIQKDGLEMVEVFSTTALILQRGRSDGFYTEHPRRIIIDTDPSIMSIITCIDLGEWLGCNRFVFLCCDSLTHDDYNTYDVFTGKIARTRGSGNYEKNKADILERVQKCRFEFVTP